MAQPASAPGARGAGADDVRDPARSLKTAAPRGAGVFGETNP